MILALFDDYHHHAKTLMPSSYDSPITSHRPLDQQITSLTPSSPIPNQPKKRSQVKNACGTPLFAACPFPSSSSSSSNSHVSFNSSKLPKSLQKMRHNPSLSPLCPLRPRINLSRLGPQGTQKGSKEVSSTSTTLSRSSTAPTTRRQDRGKQRPGTLVEEVGSCSQKQRGRFSRGGGLGSGSTERGDGGGGRDTDPMGQTQHPLHRLHGRLGGTAAGKRVHFDGDDGPDRPSIHRGRTFNPISTSHRIHLSPTSVSHSIPHQHPPTPAETLVTPTPLLPPHTPSFLNHRHPPHPQQ